MAGSLILRWVMGHKAVTALTVVILALSVALTTSRLSLRLAQVQLAEAEGREMALEGTIKAWKASYQTSHEEALVATKKLEALRKKHRKLEIDLAKKPVPEKCEEAVRWGNENLLELTRDW